MKTSFEMAKKVLSEKQMRKYVEHEVRKALMKESKESTLLSESINEVLDENMADENVFNWLKNLLGRAGQQQQGQAGGGGVSMEGIIGAILGRFFAPVLEKLLAKIGIEPKSPIGSLIVKAASTIGGYGIGQWVDKKWDPVGTDNGGFLGIGGGNGSSAGAQEGVNEGMLDFLKKKKDKKSDKDEKKSEKEKEPEHNWNETMRNTKNSAERFRSSQSSSPSKISGWKSDGLYQDPFGNKSHEDWTSKDWMYGDR